MTYYKTTESRKALSLAKELRNNDYYTNIFNEITNLLGDTVNLFFLQFDYFSCNLCNSSLIRFRFKSLSTKFSE